MQSYVWLPSLSTFLVSALMSVAPSLTSRHYLFHIIISFKTVCKLACAGSQLQFYFIEHARRRNIGPALSIPLPYRHLSLWDFPAKAMDDVELKKLRDRSKWNKNQIAKVPSCIRPVFMHQIFSHYVSLSSYQQQHSRLMIAFKALFVDLMNTSLGKFLLEFSFCWII